MKCVVQRVSSASVTIDGKIYSSIGKGLAVLVAYTEGDNEQIIEYVADKLINLRIFEDDEQKLNRSLIDVGGEMLLVSNFTIYGETAKGRRPSFIKSAPGNISEPMYDNTIEVLRSKGVEVKTGVFGADMSVNIVNDGPVTVIVEKEDR